MNRKVTFILLISLVFTSQAIFAQQEIPEMDLTLPLFYSVPYFAVTVPGEEAYIPEGIRNNEFYLESLRLTKLAHDTYEIGDYDASAGFAQEAIRFAQLSDEFVAVQLIAEAKRLVDWADKNNIANQYPIDYKEGKFYYDSSVEFHSVEDWNEAISSATKSISIFAALETGRIITTGTGMPKQYTVRTWAKERDCLWNISGYSWVYGDSSKWKVLYEANKSKMPDPSNPDLIEPGMVLDIPSIKGETREGMWRP
ncbi:MAG: LysM peptidoglycan-binding domain-containing protein [Treponema sp.]|jgi:HEPN domain-containing protein|nr:LysM peptidoglycan-binding domain-containing protein [Treponema sp.]